MSATDESETPLNHLSERINANVWRVISNPTHHTESKTDELKTLIQTMHRRQRVLGKWKIDEADPPEAA